MDRKTNYFALLLCPIYNALLGMAWYGGPLKMYWMLGHGLSKETMEHMENPALPYVYSVVSSLVTAWLLNWLFRRMGVSGWLDGLKTGATIGLFGLMGMIVMMSFANHGLQLALIEGGFFLLQYTGYGLIIGGWQKR